MAYLENSYGPPGPLYPPEYREPDPTEQAERHEARAEEILRDVAEIRAMHDHVDYVPYLMRLLAVDDERDMPKADRDLLRLCAVSDLLNAYRAEAIRRAAKEEA